MRLLLLELHARTVPFPRSHRNRPLNMSIAFPGDDSPAFSTLPFAGLPEILVWLASAFPTRSDWDWIGRFSVFKAFDPVEFAVTGERFARNVRQEEKAKFSENNRYDSLHPSSRQGSRHRHFYSLFIINSIL